MNFPMFVIQFSEPMACPLGLKLEQGRGWSKRLLVDEGETCSGASGPGLQSQLGHSCVILSRLPSLLEPHLFSSNVEQPGSRDPSNTVSYAVGAWRREAVCITLGAGWEVELSQLRNQALFSGQLEQRLGRL